VAYSRRVERPDYFGEAVAAVYDRGPMFSPPLAQPVAETFTTHRSRRRNLTGSPAATTKTIAWLGHMSVPKGTLITTKLPTTL
jgi:hypothetical protein